MNNDVIFMKDVKKIYSMGEEEVHALRGISFSVKKGEFFCLLTNRIYSFNLK